VELRPASVPDEELAAVTLLELGDESCFLLVCDARDQVVLKPLDTTVGANSAGRASKCCNERRLNPSLQSRLHVPHATLNVSRADD
jgi:hypothetical protein